jgi:hypothetical protein
MIFISAKRMGVPGASDGDAHPPHEAGPQVGPHDSRVLEVRRILGYYYERILDARPQDRPT